MTETTANPKPPQDQTAALFSRFGFDSLTEIQSKASPVILHKRDCLVVAPTGSGKTECSVIPIFSLLTLSSSNTKTSGNNGIRVLYITPLRALNRDVFRRITGYAKACSLEVGIRHGDTPQSRRKKMAENPPDVMITTPETLVMLLSQPKMLAALSRLEWVVIDEVHELLASKRGAQLSLSLERLEINAKKDLTRIGLSATVGNITEAAKFVSGTLRRCQIIQDRSVRRYDVEIIHVNGTISDAARAIYGRITGAKLESPVLLFTNTRGEAEFMASVIREHAGRIPVELHHGSLSKSVREETEHILREGGGLRIIVCTSSLELGLDIGAVELVVHYGSPRQVSKFVQRIGRSRHVRDASAQGLVVTNGADDKLEAGAILERVRRGSIERQRIHKAPLDVLAHHMVGLSIQARSNPLKLDATLEMVRRAYPYRNVSLEEFSDVIGQLESSRLVSFDRDAMTFETIHEGNNSNSNTGYAATYHYQNLSTIPDMLKFKVFDSVGRRNIGTLDQRFVGDHGEQGNVFVLRGSQWRILNIDEKSFAVNVEPARASGATGSERTVPYWEGESIPIDYETAKRVGQLRLLDENAAGQGDAADCDVSDSVTADGVIADKHNGDVLETNNKTIHTNIDYDDHNDDISNKQDPQPPGIVHATHDNVSGPSADHAVITVESQKLQGIVVLHCCFGTRINATLATLISSMLSGLTGAKVDSRSDGYRIVLSSITMRISELLLLRILQDEYDLASVVGASLAGTHNVNWRVWCVAKRFGAVSRGAIYDGKSARFLYERYKKTSIVREALRELFHDKYDLDGCRGILEGIKSGRITISWSDVSGFSSLAIPILDHTARYYSSPAALDRSVLKQVRERLAKSKHRIVCMRCGKWEKLIETRDVEGQLTCPRCRGRQITVSFHSDTDLSGIVRRRASGARLDADETRRFNRAWKVASLVESFGPVAITVMSGYGVGADTAARILRNMIQDDADNLIKQIYEAERQYVVTRGFWD